MIEWHECWSVVDCCIFPLQLGARLQRLGPEDAQFIYNACGEHCVDVATHRHGCCVMQRCLDFANAQQRAALVERICQHVLQLAQVLLAALSATACGRPLEGLLQMWSSRRASPSQDTW
jgi:Pumilio-family RNA binding repeat